MKAHPTWPRAVAELEALRTRSGRARHGACSLEGTRLFERALRQGVHIERAVASAAFLDGDEPRTVALRAALAENGTPVERVPDEVLAGLTDGRSLGGIVGRARLPAEPALADVLARADPEPPLLLACSGVDDPGNVGALVRTAHASGAAAFLGVGACDAFHPKAVRTSMGSVFAVPVLAREELAACAEELREAGVRTLGAVSAGGTPLPEVGAARGPTAVFLGSEAFGLGPDDVARLDGRVTIPMGGGVDSFSVNAAAAVLLYELRRGRG